MDTALRLMVPGTEKDVNYLLRNVLQASNDEEEKFVPKFGVGTRDINTGLYDLR